MVLGLPRGRKQYVLIGTRDQVYKVRVLASSVWVPEVRRWEPEVFIIGEGINFTVEDTTRLMQNLHSRASRHPAVQGVEAGSHGRSGEAPPLGDKGAWTRMVAKSRRRQGDFSAVSSTKPRPGTHHGMA